MEAHSDGLGKGSTFTVKLPRAAHEEAPRKAAPAEAPAAQASLGRRVLIVDDNLDAAETLAMMLDILGQQTQQAHDGHAAVTMAAEYKPDLIFMDIGLPGLSGHEAAQKIRGELGMDGIYMIALSGYGTEDDRRKSLQAGFNAHMVKPLDPSTLPGLLASAARKG